MVKLCAPARLVSLLSAFTTPLITLSLWVFTIYTPCDDLPHCALHGITMPGFISTLLILSGEKLQSPFLRGTEACKKNVMNGRPFILDSD